MTVLMWHTESVVREKRKWVDPCEYIPDDEWVRLKAKFDSLTDEDFD